jgi:hypothetical protein
MQQEKKAAFNGKKRIFHCINKRNKKIIFEVNLVFHAILANFANAGVISSVIFVNYFVWFLRVFDPLP